MKKGWEAGHQECFSCRFKLDNSFVIEDNLNCDTEKVMNYMFKSANETNFKVTKEKKKVKSKKRKRDSSEEISPNVQVDAEIDAKKRKPCPRSKKKKYYDSDDDDFDL